MTTRPTPRSSLAGALVLSTACASAPIELPAPDARLASIGNLGTRSSFELRTLYEAAPESAPREAPARDRSARKRPVTPILFYLGVGAAALLGAAALGTGIASAASRRRLDDAYFGDGLTYDEYETRRVRGERLSDATWGLGLSAFAFASMALITYSVDWIRCGPLAPKRRRITAPPGRCDDPASTAPTASAAPAQPGPVPTPTGPAPAGPAPAGPAPVPPAGPAPAH